MLSAMMSGMIPNRERNRTSISEKPLPAAPLNRTVSESPVQGDRQVSTSVSHRQRPSVNASASFQRPKKKVVWKGKTCTIALPLEDIKHEDGQPKIPLTPSEVATRQKQWENSGISTRGFDLMEFYNNDSLAGQSCDVYPDQNEDHVAVKTKKFAVRIPNKQLWDDYVKQLQEEKLRALGVTLGDEEPPPRAPSVVSQASRQASSHSPFPQVTQGLHPPSAGFRSPMEQALSPPGTAPISQFPFPPAMISPNMQPAMPRSAGFHMANQSVAFNRDRVFSPNSLSSHPASTSGQQYLGSLPSSRGVSPLMDERRQSLWSPQSSISPLPEILHNGYAQGQLAQQPYIHHEGQFSPNFNPATPNSLQQQVSDHLHKQTPKQFVSQPEIASPVPQGRSHRHNVSASLQKDIDDAEQYLESTIAQQLKDADKAKDPDTKVDDVASNAHEGSNAPDSIRAPTKSMSIVSDIETVPSQASSPRLSSAKLMPAVNHGRKTSVSKLNINAPEFVFNPGKSSFSPMFTFGDNSPLAPHSAASTGFNGSHSKTTSNTSALSAGLNVAAPAFVPGKPVEIPTNRVFSFSSTVPGLKPDAPAFTPGLVFGEIPGGAMDKRSSAGRVFSYGDMIQLPKKTKAVPIVPPDNGDDTQEDEEGRITQGDSRLKRVRRTGGSGDQVPLFATPHEEISAPTAAVPLSASETDAGDRSVLETSKAEVDSAPTLESEKDIQAEDSQPLLKSLSAEVDVINEEPLMLPQEAEERSDSVNDTQVEAPSKNETTPHQSIAPQESQVDQDQSVPVETVSGDEQPDYTISEKSTIDLPKVFEEIAKEEEQSEASKNVAVSGKTSGLHAPSPLQQIPVSPVHDTALNTADFLDAPSNLASPLPKNIEESLLSTTGDAVSHVDSIKPTDASPAADKLEDPFTVGEHDDGNHTDKSTNEKDAVPPQPEMVEKKANPGVTTESNDTTSFAAQASTPVETKKSILSAKAKPFVFNPAVSVFDPVSITPASITPTKIGRPDVPEFKPSAAQPILKSQSDIPSPEHAPPHPTLNLAAVIQKEAPPKKPVFSGGLAASRYASAEPTPMPKSPSPPVQLSSSPPLETKETKQETKPTSADISAISDDLPRRRVSSPELSPYASANAQSPSAGQYSRSVSPSEVPLAERIANGVQYVEPSFKEIDDVMKQLNGDDSDLGVERNPEQVWKSPRTAARDKIVVPERVATPLSERRKASLTRLPTSSPNHLDRPFQYLPEQDYGSSNTEESRQRDAAAELVARNARFSPSYKKSHHSDEMDDASPVHRLHRKGSGSVSNWDDIVSDDDEADFHGRVGFFDNRVGHVISNAMDDRLQPLENTLAELTSAVEKLNSGARSTKPHRSRSVESDADDEDDEDGATRAESPFTKDRRFEKLKATLLNAISQLRPPNDDIRQVLENLADLKFQVTKYEQPRSTTVDTDHASIQNLADSIAEMKLAISGKDFNTRTENSTQLTEAISELKTILTSQQTISSSERSGSSLNTTGVEELTRMIVELQTAVGAHQRSQPDHIKTIIEDTMGKHLEGQSEAVRMSQENAAAEKLQIRVTELENMLKKADERTDEEYRLRRVAEDRFADSERDLKAAIEEATQQRKAAEATEASLEFSRHEHKQSKEHVSRLEEVKVDMENSLADAQDKTQALEETIAEYRLSHDEWRKDIDAANAENADLSRTVSSLRDELEDGIASRHALKEKFERIQQEMLSATQSIARDQAAWRHKDEEHKAKHELSTARLEAEARTRERLELEIERLEKQEREAMKARTLVEDIRSQNGNLTNMVNELRSKAHHFQERSMTLERELHDTKERSRLEMQRMIGVTKNDVDSANRQSQIVRADLENVIHKLEDQISHLQGDAKGAKERYQAMLEEASVSRDDALREAAEAREAALQEHYRFHERTIHETQVSHERAIGQLKADHTRISLNTHEDHQRAISNLMEEHKLALTTAVQEKRITEQNLNGRLELSSDKISHLQDKVQHLEERLTIATSAAQAAAEAARTARSSSSLSPAGRATAPSLRGFDPQALRQTVETLQDQLGERERQIERLQQELDEVDKEAPSKVKERDAEITWLRELLGVRMDDMQDIIVQLSTPHFDRTSVRDAVIRLRANLQMEQQERERQLAGGAKFPSLSDIRASPKSLPLAAAAAWGSWRKGQSSLSSLAEMAVPSASSSADQTPSKSSPSSFLSGLLTPPNTNVRQSPRSRASLSRPTSSSQRPLASFSTPKRQISVDYNAQRQQEIIQDAPETPALLKKTAYDADAPEGPHHYSLDQYTSEEVDLPSEDTSQQGDNDSTTPPATSETHDTTSNPFGPSIELAG